MLGMYDRGCDEVAGVRPNDIISCPIAHHGLFTSDLVIHLITKFTYNISVTHHAVLYICSTTHPLITGL
jgi:hypothetical protein